MMPTIHNLDDHTRIAPNTKLLSSLTLGKQNRRRATSFLPAIFAVLEWSFHSRQSLLKVCHSLCENALLQPASATNLQKRKIHLVWRQKNPERMPSKPHRTKWRPITKCRKIAFHAVREARGDNGHTIQYSDQISVFY
jgi:hypothetical protein